MRCPTLEAKSFRRVLSVYRSFKLEKRVLPLGTACWASCKVQVQVSQEALVAGNVALTRL